MLRYYYAVDYDDIYACRHLLLPHFFMLLSLTFYATLRHARLFRLPCFFLLSLASFHAALILYAITTCLFCRHAATLMPHAAYILLLRYAAIADYALPMPCFDVMPAPFIFRHAPCHTFSRCLFSRHTPLLYAMRVLLFSFTLIEIRCCCRCRAIALPPLLYAADIRRCFHCCLRRCFAFSLLRYRRFMSLRCLFFIDDY